MSGTAKRPEIRSRGTLTALAMVMLASAGCSGGKPASDPAKVAAGKQTFQECSACHSILGDGVGPDLRSVYGRKAGTAPRFRRYSAAMRDSGITWDERSLSSFLANPAAYVRGTHMVYAGIADRRKREDLIAFLKTYQ